MSRIDQRIMDLIADAAAADVKEDEEDDAYLVAAKEIVVRAEKELVGLGDISLQEWEKTILKQAIRVLRCRLKGHEQVLADYSWLNRIAEVLF